MRIIPCLTESRGVRIIRLMWNDEDIGAVEAWHEANSAYCVECGERWLTEQMTGVYCPDCASELPALAKLQVAGEREVERLKIKVIDAAMRAMRDADPLVIRARELNQ